MKEITNDCLRKTQIEDYASTSYNYDYRDLYNILKDKDPDAWKRSEDGDFYAKGGYYNEDGEYDPLWTYCKHFTSRKAVCEYLCSILEEEMDGTTCNSKGCFFCDKEYNLGEIKMNIEIDKTQGRPHRMVASYTATLEYDVSELNIDWDKVETIWCKHSTLFILMDDGTKHEIENYNDPDIDYKWPTNLQLVDDDYMQLWEDYS